MAITCRRCRLHGNDLAEYDQIQIRDPAPGGYEGWISSWEVQKLEPPYEWKCPECGEWNPAPAKEG